MGSPKSVEPETLDSGAYAERLAELNEIQQVKASEDVYSVHGVLVARAGTVIDYDTARKIVRHKLTMPLGNNIELEHPVTGKLIYQSFKSILSRYSDIRNAHRALGSTHLFQTLLENLRLQGLLAQKLTVVEAKEPSLWTRSIVGAWVAAMLGVELRLSNTELDELTLAALCRDLGTLHVRRDCFNREPGNIYPSGEWREIQSHVVASHMILKECDDIPKRVMTAVLEHHEHADGTGYPSNKYEKELSLFGEILSLADIFADLRVRRFAGSGRTIGDIPSALKIQGHFFREDIIRALHSFVQRANLKKSAFHPYKSRALLEQSLCERTDIIRQIQTLLEEIVRLAAIDRFEGKSVSNFAVRLLQTITRSGVATDELKEWLLEVIRQKGLVDLVELSEIELFQSELLWALHQLRQLIVSHSAQGHNGFQENSEGLLEQLDSFFDDIDWNKVLMANNDQ